MRKTKRCQPDVVLLQPPGWSVQSPSMGLALLKSYLETQQISVKIIDLNILLYNLSDCEFSKYWDESNGYFVWERESLVERLFCRFENEIGTVLLQIIALAPPVIGLSLHSSSFLSGAMLARLFRKLIPGTKIIMGGPAILESSVSVKTLIEESLVDALFYGESELSLLEYIRRYKRGELDNGEGIPGVSLKLKDGVVTLPKTEEIRDLDELPFADYSDFDLSLYAAPTIIPTYFSRGCINRCIYCSEGIYFKRFRNRTGARVFAEISYQLKHHPHANYIRLHDSVSNGNMRELREFCLLMKQHKLGVQFNLENAVIRKEMTAEFYQLLKEAGCTAIGLGLEHPSKALLSKIGKKACLDSDFDRVITDGVKSKMSIGINLMFGLPGETEEESLEQLNFIKKYRKYRKNIVVNPSLIFCMFPEGSLGYSHPEKYQIDVSQGPMFWKSMDGKNNLISRMTKFENLCKAIDNQGFDNLFHVTMSTNRYEMLGKYYENEKLRDKAFLNYCDSWINETRTIETAERLVYLKPEEQLNEQQKTIIDEARRHISEHKLLLETTALFHVKDVEQLIEEILVVGLSRDLELPLLSIAQSRNELLRQIKKKGMGFRKKIKSIGLWLVSKLMQRETDKMIKGIQLLRWNVNALCMIMRFRKKEISR